MEFKNLIESSSMIRDVLGNIVEENNYNDEIAESIEKLKKDLEKFENLINE